MKCEYCDNEIPGGINKCPYCGASVVANNPVGGQCQPSQPLQQPQPSGQSVNINIQHPQPNYVRYQPQEKDEASGCLILLALFIPLVGWICGFVYRAKGKTTAGNTYLLVATISFIIYFLLELGVN